MSDIIWSEDAWADYLYWQGQDRRTLRRINTLVKDILCNGPASGIGKPEPLTGNLRGEYSRRIDEKNRWSITSRTADCTSSAVGRTMVIN